MIIRVVVSNKKWNYKLWFSILACVVMFAAICFGSIYIYSTRIFLIDWYYHLNSCFYLSEKWTNDFFTPHVKQVGNIYCSIQILTSLLGIYTLAKSIRFNLSTPEEKKVYYLNTLDLIFCGIAIIFSIGAWVWGTTSTHPFFDEVFSAINCADIHPFQTISYYMLPNNHILFNLLNGMLFYSAADKVVSGRILSLLAYCGLIITTYWYFRKVMDNRWFVLLACITVSLQFTTWGFSFQARGYELYGLAEFWVFISLTEYISSTNTKWLIINTLCCIIAFYCLPTFLYYYVAVIIFITLYQLINRKWDATIWKYQLSTLFITFLLYLPALCFSGLTAIIENKYVQPTGYKPAEFYNIAWEIFGKFINYCFSDILHPRRKTDLILFLSPLFLLLFYKNRKDRIMSCFYIVLMLICFLMTLGMRRMPFERNLIGHFQLVFFMAIYVTNKMIIAIEKAVRKNYIKFLFPVFLIMASAILIGRNKKYINFYLYWGDISNTYSLSKQEVSSLDKKMNIAFGGECFYLYYLCAKNGYNVHKCLNATDAYYIKSKDEYLPQLINDKYIITNSGAYYEIYKKR